MHDKQYMNLKDKPTIFFTILEYCSKQVHKEYTIAVRRKRYFYITNILDSPIENVEVTFLLKLYWESMRKLR